MESNTEPVLHSNLQQNWISKTGLLLWIKNALNLRRGNREHMHMFQLEMCIGLYSGRYSKFNCMITVVLKSNLIHFLGFIYHVILYHSIPSVFRLIPSHNMLHTWCQLQAHMGMILEVPTQRPSFAVIWLLILKLYPIFHWSTSDCYLYLCKSVLRQIRTLFAASTGGITQS
jgi:hypothetical protein